MAGERDGNSRASTPEPPCQQRAIPLASTSKFRTGADVELIEMVRVRPVLYDPSHSRYMDNPLKNLLWTKIGKQLEASPSACKARWNNIRDNYRKALRRRNRGGKMHYKFADLLGFMDNVFKGGSKKSLLGDSTHNATANSENSNDSGGEEKIQEMQAMDDARSDHDALSNQSEAFVDYDMFDKSANACAFPPNTAFSFLPKSTELDAVDVFLAAIAPTLKGLSQYNLSLAKAEIFATVHKYELKGIMGNDWTPREDVKPLP